MFPAEKKDLSKYGGSYKMAPTSYEAITPINGLING